MKWHHALALVLCGACRATAVQDVSSAPTPKVRVGTRARAWEILSAGERIGLVVLFQDRGLVHDSVYIVRNTYHQDIGLIDGHGRAYRYVPHLEEPVWVGSGTISAGAQAILGVGASCELIELDGALNPLPAAEPLAAAPLPPVPTLPDGGLPQSR